MKPALAALAALALAWVGACVDSKTVVCDDGRLCPDGTVCAQLTNPDETLCVPPADVHACDGLEPFAECQGVVGSGRCYDGVCLPAGCGNGRIDPGEVCDDRNFDVGDGCSHSCLSDESCGNGLIDPLPLTVDPVTGATVAKETCDDGNLLGHDGCHQCTQETRRWQPLLYGRPEGRLQLGMTFDTARRRFVLFGGNLAGGVVLRDTWESDGTGWIRIPTPIAPSPRGGHALAYDARRRRVVLFGGSSGGALDDTWEWDGSSWTLRHPTVSPPARLGHGMVYDARRGRIVMFGGWSGTFAALPADTWEYDGTTWTIAATSGPEMRFRHAMGYDPERGVVVVAGGTEPPPNPSAIVDTWEYNGTSWSQNPAITPSGMVGVPMAFDAPGHRMIAYGGMFGPGLARTLGYDGVEWKDLDDDTPQPLVEQAMASDPISGRVLMFGGSPIDVPTDSQWMWDGASWSMSAPRPPPGKLSRMATTYDPLHARLVLFGGVNGSGTVVGDTWELVGLSWRRIPADVTTPPARFVAAMAYDPGRDEVVMFGGSAIPSNGLGDTWTWDGSAWTEHAVSGPPERFLDAMAYAPALGDVVMYGGRSSIGIDRGDSWRWAGTFWADVPLGPAGRYGHAMCADPIAGSVLLSGGASGVGVLTDDAWELSAVPTWSSLSPLTPRLDGHSLIWDAPRQRVLLIGGASVNGTTESEVWDWDGTSWRVVVTEGALASRSGAAVFPGPDGASVIAYGGDDNRYRGTFTGISAERDDFARLAYDNTRPYEICAGTYDHDEDGLAGCADPDCWVMCTPLCPPGATCDDADPHCGDGTCNAALENCRNCPTDCTCPAACGDNSCDAGETAAVCPGDCP